ncbi:SRPBCC family protein [Gordonia sp. (in: high G+C Gram-positive bacteria)]|uniref:SRPBCC family protein n=1 Tax=Gordonia sp. (in: high G+C Gram-positive bacteria) TaxID=84139 RepID=UPI0016AB93E0|nr:SRPBCC family protein [Gordonia sp. (in: high G+C Gram-positive bacteria)]NLG45222.1 SRPBCC family protein [Gordonia sp. (in: high G+C Gram-positive bacteria)]
MAVSASTEFDVNAPASLVMEILLDIESLPDWSGPHKSAKIVTTDAEGRPDRVEVAVSAVGMTDNQTLDYTWTDTVCSWTLVESDQLSLQQGTYTLTENGGKTHVQFDLTVDLKIKLPGLIIKRAQKMAVDTAKKGLTDEVKRRS